MTVVGDAQVALETIITVIVDGFAKEVVVNTEPVAPAILIPFLCHWYVGKLPPLAGVAVKVTAVPEFQQISKEEEVILTAGTKTGFTVIVPVAVTWLQLPVVVIV